MEKSHIKTYIQFLRSLPTGIGNSIFQESRACQGNLVTRTIVASCGEAAATVEDNFVTVQEMRGAGKESGLI